MNVYLNSCEHTQGLKKTRPHTAKYIAYIVFFFYHFSLAYTDRSSCPRGGQENLCCTDVLQTCQNVKITKQITYCFPANSGVL